MRITITGASGLIGSKLVTALRERGDEVTTVSLRNGPPDPADLAGRAAIRLLYGDMAEIVTKGQRVVPKRTVELGYTYQHADLDEALEAAVG